MNNVSELHSAISFQGHPTWPDWVTDGSGLDYNTYGNRIASTRTNSIIMTTIVIEINFKFTSTRSMPPRALEGSPHSLPPQNTKAHHLHWLCLAYFVRFLMFFCVQLHFWKTKLIQISRLRPPRPPPLCFGVACSLRSLLLTFNVNNHSPLVFYQRQYAFLSRNS